MKKYEAYLKVLAKVTADTFVDQTIGMPEIYASIQKLKNNVSPGPDGIFFEMFKHGAVKLSPALSALFELVMSGQPPPQVWHTGIIAPLYKKLNRLMPINYRSVVLRSAVAKLFERIIMASISRVMEWGWPAATHWTKMAKPVWASRMQMSIHAPETNSAQIPMPPQPVCAQPRFSCIILHTGQP